MGKKTSQSAHETTQQNSNKNKINFPYPHMPSSALVIYITTNSDTTIHFTKAPSSI
jgi:hypothetical protein